MTYSEEDLWNMMRFLYSNVTLQDFEETLKLEGFEDTKTRLLINFRNRIEMIEKYGGDGKDKIRELYNQFKNGELDKKNILTKGQKEILEEILNG